MDYRQRLIRLFAVCALLALVSTNGARAGEIWHNDWIVHGQPLFRAASVHAPPRIRSAYAFGIVGDLLALTSADYYDAPYAGYQLTSVGPTGALRWSSGVAGDDIEVSGFQAAIPDGGGGFFIDFAGYYQSRLAHYSATGMTLWTRNLDVKWLTSLEAGRLATLGCNDLTMFNAGTGNVEWERRIDSTLPYDCSGGLASGPAGYVYAGLEIRASASPDITGFRLLKVGADGAPQWDVSTIDALLLDVVGANATHVFIRTATDLRALRTSDGSVAWSKPMATDARVLMAQDASPEPVAVDAQSVVRVNGDTGRSRWSVDVSASTDAVDIVGESIVVAGNGGVTKIGLVSGAIEWTGVGSGIPWVGFGGATGSSFIGVAGNAGNPDASFAQRISTADGSLTDLPLPPIPFGLLAASVVDDDGGVVSAGVTQHSDHAELHTRKVDGQTGATLWDVTGPDLCCANWRSVLPAIGAGGGTVAISLASSYGCGEDSISPGVGMISARERADGSLRWQFFLADVWRQCVKVSAPVVDANENVYASMSYLVTYTDAQGFPHSVNRQTLFKFAAQTGLVLWQIDDDTSPFYLQPVPAFSLSGSDILLMAPFGSTADTMRRLSGADGSTIWSASVFPINRVTDPPQPIDATHDVVFGTTDTDVVWASVDTQTGDVQWTASIPNLSCAPLSGCSFFGSRAVQWGGDTVVGGQRDFKAKLDRYRNDGSGIADHWILAMGDIALRSAVAQEWTGPSMSLYTLLYQGFGLDQGSLRFLSSFDSANGTLGDKQTVFSSTPNEPGRLPTALGAPGIDRLLAQTSGSESDQAVTSGATLFDTLATAHGNLAIHLVLDSYEVQVGGRMGFHLSVTYQGDEPLTGVRVAATVPWQSGIAAPFCSGTNCVLDTSRGNLAAKFDIAPGDSVDVGGQVLVLDQWVHPSMSARVWGPMNLSEVEVLDNFTQARPVAILFADGFDP